MCTGYSGSNWSIERLPFQIQQITCMLQWSRHCMKCRHASNGAVYVNTVQKLRGPGLAAQAQPQVHARSTIHQRRLRWTDACQQRSGLRLLSALVMIVLPEG